MTDIAAVVAAAASSRGIGAAGNLAWRLPADMAFFKKVTITPPEQASITSSTASTTLTNAVIMGRKTWESIPPKFRPLDNRINVILTRNSTYASTIQSSSTNNSNNSENNNVMVCTSIEEAITSLQQKANIGHIFIIGGGQVYQDAIELGLVNKVIYTKVDNFEKSIENSFDTFFPDLDEEWDCRPYPGEEQEEEEEVVTDDVVEVGTVVDEKKEGEEVESKTANAKIHTDAKSGLTFQFLEYTRKSNKKSKLTKEDSEMPAVEEGAHVNPEEMQYLEMIQDIIENGVERGDRTGTGTLSKFGTQMRFSLRDGTLPLLTTKRTFWRGVAEELLWFVQGNTNANDLAAKDIHIWDGNGSREFLDSRNLEHREEGDLGPVYGFQWRHFGAKYVDMHTDYTGQGVDQLAECIDKIKNHPEDRRIIMSAWNPSDLDVMALPPCHMFCQFYVDTKKNELSCQMYQRSADMGLGVPFNIASYALLTIMIAHVTGRKPGDFVHTIGDAHVYLNHVDALKEQLKRSPRAFPKIKVNPEKKNIDDFEFSDFEVIGYKPHKTIKMKMAV
mmetsp:Transcript_24153/g.29740  ORF Transcript_24153/g.29740 Transcript_24153/m.29740 type:complete len:559 (+) Transcript_24153:128-1804(+)